MSPVSFKSRKFVAIILAVFLISSLAAWILFEGQRYRKVRVIEVNFGEKVGIIKSLQGVDDGPLSDFGTIDLSSYYLDLNITHIRLHDFWGGVDIDQVFPDIDADPDVPSNYYFSQTDRYLEKIKSIGADIIYRLGYSWERPPQTPIHNAPPKDYDKWASICIHVIRHYNDGWAGGFHYSIRYWEIWNEPDIGAFWTGTAEKYYELYEVTARAIKAYDPSLKVGGPALAGSITFLNGFLGYCKDRDVPLSFVSWHIYSDDPHEIYARSSIIRELLRMYGFQDAESILTEWNMWVGIEPANMPIFGTIKAAAFDASALIYLQDSPPNIATFYRGDTWDWGLFNPDGSPRRAYYTFKAFKMLLDTPVRVFCNGSDENGLAAIAGLSGDSQTATILISNFNSTFNSYEVRVKNLWESGQTEYEVYSIDSSRNIELVRTQQVSSPSFSILEDIEVPSVLMIRLIKT